MAAKKIGNLHIAVSGDTKDLGVSLKKGESQISQFAKNTEKTVGGIPKANAKAFSSMEKPITDFGGKFGKLQDLFKNSIFARGFDTSKFTNTFKKLSDVFNLFGKGAGKMGSSAAGGGGAGGAGSALARGAKGGLAGAGIGKLIDYKATRLAVSTGVATGMPKYQELTLPEQIKNMLKTGNVAGDPDKGFTTKGIVERYHPQRSLMSMFRGATTDWSRGYPARVTQQSSTVMASRDSVRKGIALYDREDISGRIGWVANKGKQGASAVAGGVAKYGRTAVMGTLAAGITVAGIAAATATVQFKKQAHAIDALAKEARALGVSTKAWAGMQLAADLSGVSAGELGVAMKTLQKNVGDAYRGFGEAGRALKDLNIDAKMLAQQNPADQLQTIAKAFAKINNNSKRISIANQLFGEQGGKLQAMLGGVLVDAMKEASAAGLGVTESQAQAVETMNDSFTKIAAQWTGFWRQTTAALAPTVGALADSFLGAVKVFTGGDMSAYAKAFAAAEVSNMKKLGTVAKYAGWGLITRAFVGDTGAIAGRGASLDAKIAENQKRDAAAAAMDEYHSNFSDARAGMAAAANAELKGQKDAIAEREKRAHDANLAWRKYEDGKKHAAQMAAIKDDADRAAVEKYYNAKAKNAEDILALRTEFQAAKKAGKPLAELYIKQQELWDEQVKTTKALADHFQQKKLALWQAARSASLSLQEKYSTPEELARLQRNKDKAEALKAFNSGAMAKGVFMDLIKRIDAEYKKAVAGDGKDAEARGFNVAGTAPGSQEFADKLSAIYNESDKATLKQSLIEQQKMNGLLKKQLNKMETKLVAQIK